MKGEKIILRKKETLLGCGKDLFYQTKFISSFNFAASALLPFFHESHKMECPSIRALVRWSIRPFQSVRSVYNAILLTNSLVGVSEMIMVKDLF